MSTRTELCLSNFLEQTAEATDWYLLGAFMNLPPKDLSLIEKQFSSGGPTRCKAELFNVWIKRTPNASWELIAAALEKSGETALAEKIRKLSVTVQINSCADSSAVVLKIESSLVDFFLILESEFAAVVTNLKMSLEEKQVSLKKLGRFLDTRLDLDGESMLSHFVSIDDIFQQIKPHFCLFNTVILKDIVENFVGDPLKEQLQEYKSKVEKFTETTTMSLLKKVEFLDQSSSADMPQVIFKLTGFWPSVTIRRFQRFVDHVFEANSSALTHIRVKQGCICVTWYARKSAIASLAARAQEKVLFMRHVGVLSLSVGDTVILEQEETEEEETVEEETDLSSALIQAITADCTEAVEFLLFLDADPNYTLVYGTTPLILACWNNSISIAKLLLRAEANVNAQDHHGITALKMASSFKIPNKILIDLLVQSGAQFVISGEIQSALGIAAQEGHTDIVQYLISKGAPVNAQGIYGANSLMYACWHKHADTVRILLDNGADPNIQGQDDNTALHIACYKQMTVGVELLLAYGADHSLQSKDKTTPLMNACFKEGDFTMDSSILILLLSAGADPNALTQKDSTALVVAAHFGYKEGVTVLLNAGANVNIQNKFGMTALHEAAENGFLVISELLLASGAQASLTDNDGMTPLDYALDNNHHDVCQLLLASIDSAPLPAMTESTSTSETHVEDTDLSLFMAETIEQEATPQHRRRRSRTSQHSSAFSTLDQLRYALEYPLSPDDTIKHHQADEEEEIRKPGSSN